jgi:uncharacterized protein
VPGGYKAAIASGLTKRTLYDKVLSILKRRDGMQSIKGISAAALSCATLLGTAAHAGSLTVDFTGVHSATGNIVVALCGDAAAPFPGACVTFRGMAPAALGQVKIRIDNVSDGVYALQAFHDENGNFRPETPQEGVAFGNDAPGRPAFQAAALKVSGDAQVAVKMVYGGGATSTAERAPSHGFPAPAGVQRVDLREQGLYGEYYVPTGSTGPMPGLVLIGGSEGGLDVMSGMATSFAEEGFAVLALAYWGEQGLPTSLENIPLEYFDRAVAWLQQQPQVARGGVGMLGWSRGTEAALLTAARNPAIHAVVAVAPSGTVWKGLHYSGNRAPLPAWTVRGKPVPSLTLDSSGYRPNAPLASMFTASFGAVEATPDVQIPVENTQGGVLLISGGKDGIWPSTRFADRIAARLQATGFQHALLHLDYSDAGHAVFVGHPDGPMARSLSSPNPAMGGTTESNAAAWRDNWPKTVAFLRQQLPGAK